jgi:hypothetical protein
MTGWRNIIWALAAVVTLGSTAFAQGGGASSTGSISGEVKDAQGGVLPGVTVTATSPAQIGQLTAVTNEAGIYRFPAVPPGEYRLAYELSGFQASVRDGLRVTLGANTQINLVLNVATLQESVTVSGASPVIDTSATRMQTNYDQQMLSSLPNARDMWSLLATTPSVTLNRVDVGGSTMGTQTTYFAYGYSGQNRPLVEGINTTEGTAAAGFYLDYGSFEEVFIGAAGNSAEMPNPGVLTQFVSKSGGNTPTVNFYYDYENDTFQSKNLTADQVIPATGATIRQDGNRLASYKNLNLGLGGPIIKDKMWGFYAYLNQSNSVAAPPAGSILDGTPFDTKLFNHTGKATYQLNQANKVVAYLQFGTKQQPHRTDSSNRLGAPVHIAGDSTTLQDSPSWVYKGEWNGTLGQNAFAELRAGQFGYNFGLDSNTDATRYEDLITNEIRGGGRHWLNKRRRDQYTGALSFFKDNFAGGSHNFKVGGEYLDESGNIMWDQGYSDSVIHFLNNGVANSVRLYNSGTSSQNALGTTSLFVTDTWTVDRLTLNVGGRFDRYVVSLPEQSIPASRFNPVARTFAAVSEVVAFNQIVPRLGASYDLMGDGKLGPLLLQPRRESRRRDQSKHQRSVRRHELGRSQRRPHLSSGRRDHRDPARWRHGGLVDRSEHQGSAYRRSLDVRRARGAAGPRRARRLRVEERQRRLAAPEHGAADERLQRTGGDSRSRPRRHARQRRRRREHQRLQPRRSVAAGQPGHRHDSGLRGHL